MSGSYVIMGAGQKLRRRKEVEFYVVARASLVAAAMEDMLTGKSQV